MTAIGYAVAWAIYIPVVFIVPTAERKLGLRPGGAVVAPATAEPPLPVGSPLATTAAAAVHETVTATMSVRGGSLDVTPLSEIARDWDLEGDAMSPDSTTTSAASNKRPPRGEGGRTRGDSERRGFGNSDQRVRRNRKGKEDPDRQRLLAGATD